MANPSKAKRMLQLLYARLEESGGITPAHPIPFPGKNRLHDKTNNV
jgi:hypothetical protein